MTTIEERAPEPIVCKCQWKEYYDYRVMMPNGEGHVRLSIYKDEAIISDLYVAEEHRHEGYATILLDKVDELLRGQKAFICPLKEWEKRWYERRGYIITDCISKECYWHDASVVLPEEDKEAIVLYDNGYLCFNHRPKLGGYLVRSNGEKTPYQPLIDKDGWCDYSKQLTMGHKIVLWTENPMEE